MSKPTTHLDWTNGEASKVQEPVAGKKELGWSPLERPPAEFMNWLFYTQDLWNKYFESITDVVLASGSVFDAVVGVGGTHESLTALMADSQIATLKNILVVSPFALDETIVIDQDGMRFTFKPQATISKATADLAFRITGDRIVLDGLRVVNFNGANNEAIRIDNDSKNNMIVNSYFLNNTETIVDNGQNNNFVNNIEEVL